MEDSRRGEADMYPELTVPTENDTVTVFASPGMNEILKKTLEPKRVTMKT